jgi:hypothetical protein
MPISRTAPPRARRRLVAATVAVTGLAGALLTAQPAFADPSPSATPDLTSLSTWHEWINPANYDYGLTTKGGEPVLRMSNAIESGYYGNITQLSSPAIAEVGEPGNTAAQYRVFTAEYTVDADSYLAQPGLAVEVSGDKGGNRSGGGVVFRHDADNELTLSTYWADAGSEADLPDWNNDTATVPFTAPVHIRYVVEYDPAGVDSVKVWADGVLAISGEGYEAYHDAVGSPAQTIDSLLFRTSRSVPVPGGAWDVVEPTAPQKTAIHGHGFYFGDISYAASNSMTLAAGISGTVAVNGVLTAEPDVNVGGASYTYQWLRGGLSIPGATQSTYTLAANDVNKRISVRITAKKTGFTQVTATSAQTTPVSAATLTFSTPAEISGTAKLGSTLTASAATTPAASYTYQWYRDGAAIKGAVAKTYKQSVSDVGRAITVKVTASKAGYASLSSTSAPTADVAPGTLKVGTVTIAGAFQVGGNLNALTSGWTSGTTLKYAFYSDGDLVQLSASKTFRLTWEEKGTRISVIVIGSKPGYHKAESAETTPRGPVR